MAANTIRCTDYDEFVEVIYRLVDKGLVFEADATALTITLTGGL